MLMHKPSLLNRFVKLFDRWFNHMEKKYEGHENDLQEGSEETLKALEDINKSLGLSDKVDNPYRFL